jgi:hypothetical protein
MQVGIARKRIEGLRQNAESRIRKCEWLKNVTLSDDVLIVTVLPGDEIDSVGRLKRSVGLATIRQKRNGC